MIRDDVYQGIQSLVLVLDYVMTRGVVYSSTGALLSHGATSFVLRCPITLSLNPDIRSPTCFGPYSARVVSDF